MFGFAAPSQGLNGLKQWASSAAAQGQQDIADPTSNAAFVPAMGQGATTPQLPPQPATGQAPGAQGPSVSDIFHSIAQHFGGGSGQAADPNAVVNMNAGAGPSAAAQALSGSSDSPELIKYLASFLG